MPEQNAYVILGAYGGIGSELARRLAAKGTRLMLVGRDEARLAALTAEILKITGQENLASSKRGSRCRFSRGLSLVRQPSLKIGRLLRHY